MVLVTVVHSVMLFYYNCVAQQVAMSPFDQDDSQRPKHHLVVFDDSTINMKKKAKVTFFSCYRGLKKCKTFINIKLKAQRNKKKNLK